MHWINSKENDETNSAGGNWYYLHDGVKVIVKKEKNKFIVFENGNVVTESINSGLDFNVTGILSNGKNFQIQFEKKVYNGKTYQSCRLFIDDVEMLQAKMKYFFTREEYEKKIRSDFNKKYTGTMLEYLVEAEVNDEFGRK